METRRQILAEPNQTKPTSQVQPTPPLSTQHAAAASVRRAVAPASPSRFLSLGFGWFMADGDSAAASWKLTELPASGDEKGLPRRGKASSGRTLNTAQIPLVASHPEVYEPCDDSFALVDALLSDKAQLLALQPRFCLEIGCGSGYVMTSLAIMLRQLGSGTQYLATDINQHAAETTQATLEAHGVHADVIATDIVSGLEKRLAGMVDVVVVNPPYVPTPEEEIECKGIASSWAGGLNGRQVIDRILPAVRKMLSERGWLYMIALEENDPSDICHLMSELGRVLS